MAISLLASAGVLVPSKTIADPDIQVGISNMILCIEMMLFAVLHIWAFSYRPYVLRKKKKSATAEAPTADIEDGKDEGRYYGGFLGFRAFMDAFNPWDLVKAVARSARWVLVGRRKRLLDPSYQQDHPNGERPATDFPAPNVTSYDGAAGFDGKPDSQKRYSSNSEENQNLLAGSQKIPLSPVPHAPTADIGLATWKYDDDHTTKNNNNLTPNHAAPNIFSKQRQEMETDHSQWERSQQADYQRRYNDMVRREAEQEPQSSQNQMSVQRAQSRRAPHDPFRDPTNVISYSPPRNRGQQDYEVGVAVSGDHHEGGRNRADTNESNESSGGHHHPAVGVAYPMDPPEVQRVNRQTQHYQGHGSQNTSPIDGLNAPSQHQPPPQGPFVQMPESKHYQLPKRAPIPTGQGQRTSPTRPPQAPYPGDDYGGKF